jgi:hypothetical protein
MTLFLLVCLVLFTLFKTLLDLSIVFVVLEAFFVELNGLFILALLVKRHGLALIALVPIRFH